MERTPGKPLTPAGDSVVLPSHVPVATIRGLDATPIDSPPTDNRLSPVLQPEGG